MPPNKKHIHYRNNDIVSDKGARIKLKITRPTHTSQSSVGDLTTVAKKLIFTLVDSSNNKMNNCLHDEDINIFLKSHMKKIKQNQVLNIYQVICIVAYTMSLSHSHHKAMLINQQF